MSLQESLINIKNDFETAITSRSFNGRLYANGSFSKTALIRSQKLIHYIHEFIKEELINIGISDDIIYPRRNNTTPEIEIKGFFRKKKQDISIVPSSDLINKAKSATPEVEKILTINVRSQLSSLAKNIDTLYERTFAEALNLHLRYPNQVLGEVYLIPSHEYDEDAMKHNIVSFKSHHTNIESYITLFQAINQRGSASSEEYKYERVVLLIVNFSRNEPRLYNSIEELKEDELVKENFNINLKPLSINNFISRLIEIYNGRFPSALDQ